MVSELNIEAILSLQVELGGLPDGSKRGLLNHSLPIQIKFSLRQLLLKLEPQIKLFYDMKNEVVAKFANGKESVEIEIDGKPNPDYFKCLEEIGNLLQQTIIIEHPVFKIEDFDFSTDENFPVFFMIIENGMAQQNGSEKKKAKSEKPKSA